MLHLGLVLRDATLLAISVLLWWWGISEDAVRITYDLEVKDMSIPTLLEMALSALGISLPEEIQVLDYRRALLLCPNGIACHAQSAGDWEVFHIVTFFGLELPVAKAVLAAGLLVFRTLNVNRQRLVPVALLALTLSRWAAVDSIVEAALVGGLLHVPGMSPRHEFGFLAFTLYVFVSAVSMLLLVEAGREKVQMIEVLSVGEAPSHRLFWPSGGDKKRKLTLVALSTVSLFVFAFAFAGGLFSTAIHVWMADETKEALVRQELTKHFPEDLLGAIEDDVVGMVLPSIDINVHVSIQEAVRALFASGNSYTVWGSFFLFMGAGAVPVISSILQQVAVLDLEVARRPTFQLLRHIAGHLAFLDVLVVGLFLGARVAGSKHSDLRAEIVSPGFWYLVAAAVSWHLHGLVCWLAVSTPGGNGCHDYDSMADDMQQPQQPAE